MKLKPYPKYKDSGIQWIGEIPEGWKIRKLKYNYEIIGKTDIPASEGNENGKYPFFTSGETIKFVDKPIVNGEYVIVGDGGIPNFKYYKAKFSYSDHCFLLNAKKEVETRFIYYFLIGNLESLDVLCFQGMGLRNLDKYKFNSFLACFPPFSEQTIIANFLDKKTAKIDALIEKDKKLIQLLKEKRTALINHAVTKGLPAKALAQAGLDPNVKLKDSGIPWIGEIPEGWEVIKLKFIADERKEKERDGKEKSLLGLENIESSTTKIIEYNSTENIEGESLKFEKNDVLFGKLRPYLAKVTLVDRDGCCTSELIVYKSSKKILPKFLMYKLVSKRYIDYVNSLTYGVKMPRADPNTLSNIKQSIPPKEEQQKIVEYLDKATAKIDKTIKLIEKKIALLQEYKKSLIHYAVTGKVDVKEVKI